MEFMAGVGRESGQGRQETGSSRESSWPGLTLSLPGICSEVQSLSREIPSPISRLRFRVCCRRLVSSVSLLLHPHAEGTYLWRAGQSAVEWLTRCTFLAASRSIPAAWGGTVMGEPQPRDRETIGVGEAETGARVADLGPKSHPDTLGSTLAGEIDPGHDTGMGDSGGRHPSYRDRALRHGDRRPNPIPPAPARRRPSPATRSRANSAAAAWASSISRGKSG